MTAPISTKERGLTEAQRKALSSAVKAGSLFRSPVNLWRWYATLPNGMSYIAAGNPTVFVLGERGLLKQSGPHSVIITPAGRRTLSESGPE